MPSESRTPRENSLAALLSRGQPTRDVTVSPPSRTTKPVSPVGEPSNDDVDYEELPTLSRRALPEADFIEVATHDLASSEPIESRAAFVETIQKEFLYYPADSIMPLLDSADDLTIESAPINARTVGFTLLEAFAHHRGLSGEQRETVFQKIIRDADFSQFFLQVKCLDVLTNAGIAVEPFADDLIDFLIRSVPRQYNAVAAARRGASKAGDKPKTKTVEELGFHSFLELFRKVVRHNLTSFRSHDLALLTAELIYVCESTSSRNDMNRVVLLLGALIQGDLIPDSKLESCIDTLCAIFKGVVDARADTWACIDMLLTSSRGQKVLDILFQLLHKSSSNNEPRANMVCGALLTLNHLIDVAWLSRPLLASPRITDSELIGAMSDTYHLHGRILRECLHIMVPVIARSATTLDVHDWEQLINILLSVPARIKQPTNSTPQPPSSTSSRNLPTAKGKEYENNAQASDLFKLRDLVSKVADAMAETWCYMAPQARDITGRFFSALQGILAQEDVTHFVILLFQQFPVASSEHDVLAENASGKAPSSRASTEVLSMWQSNQHGSSEFSPEDKHGYDPKAFSEGLLARRMDRQVLASLPKPDWLECERQVVRILYLDKLQSPETRLLVIQCLRERMPNVMDVAKSKHYEELYGTLANRHGDNLAIVNALGELCAGWLETTSHDGESMYEFLNALLRIKDASDATPGAVEGSNINNISRALAAAFIRQLDGSAKRASCFFDLLVLIARDRELATSVRLPAIRLLIRIRCTHDLSIVVRDLVDQLNLAAMLCRTEEGGAMAHEEQLDVRTGRSSSTKLNRQSLRSASGPIRAAKPTPPLWIYPGGPALPVEPPTTPSPRLKASCGTSTHDESDSLKMRNWLEVVINILQQPVSTNAVQRAADWEIYSYIIVHLPTQLCNVALFSDSALYIKLLRNILTSQLLASKFRDPPANTNVKKGDVALCLFHALIMLLGYCEHFARTEQDDMVKAFLAGVGAWDRTSKVCIHALTLCYHEIPSSVTRSLNAILQKMSQIITQSQVAVDILEYLGGLARIPALYVNFREEEYRTVFAICVRYLEHAREQRQKALGGSQVNSPTVRPNRASGFSTHSGGPAETASISDVHKDLPQYVFALAYHVITVWFLALKLMDRPDHVGWITSNLAWKDSQGREVMEEQSQVTLDMMHRTAYLDLGETVPATNFKPDDGIVLKKRWLLGLSIVTIETAVTTGLTQVTKRQASGTTSATYIHQTAPLPPHHVANRVETMSSAQGPASSINVFPNHIFLQLTSTIAPLPSPLEPICLPDDEGTLRAITAFDRNDTVDGYRVGVIYIANKQKEEAEILANAKVSKAFEEFLEGLGTKVELKGATFNAQGLDKVSDADGSHTYAWRDRVVEIIFHIPTMMPTMEDDPRCVNKKKHIGNDFVNIIFNESGLPFDFDTFPSQFNSVNIVIAPANLLVPHEDDETPEHTHFTITTVSHPTFPSISPCAQIKLLPLASIAPTARQVALNASVFANVWTARDSGEHVSSWRNRLREIGKLRERFANTTASTGGRFPGAKGSKTYVDGDLFRGRVEMGGLAEEEGVLAGLDFSRWAGPNPPLS